MTGYYFRSIATGEKVTANSVQEISRLAQREATRFDTSVQVFTEATRKSHRKMSMARNPTKKPGMYSVSYYVPAERMWQFAGEFDHADALKRAQYLSDNGSPNVRVRRISAKRNFERNPIIEEYAEHMIRMRQHAAKPAASVSRLAAKAPWYVRATKAGKVVTHKLMSKAQAIQVGEAYRDQGHKVEVMRRNPATKASKARKSGAHKRGCYVEYSYGSGTPTNRLKCGNRGIATIRANELKRSGAKGVKIIGA